MHLHISDHKTVEDLQDRFNLCFPYLKIEFYKDEDTTENRKCNIATSNTRIGELRKKAGPEIFDIKSWDKTECVKQGLKEIYGLHVQIFRLHKNEWIPTSYSNELTLKQQCELAQAVVAL